jgi:hypothetical protein
MVTVILIGLTIAVEFIVSLQGISTWRHEKEPILEALKLTSFISALLGLVLVQTAALGHGGVESNIYFDSVGLALGAVSFCIGGVMIVSGRRKMGAAHV